MRINIIFLTKTKGAKKFVVRVQTHLDKLQAYLFIIHNEAAKKKGQA